MTTTDTATFRMNDKLGRQIVRVAGGCGFTWDGDQPLHVGDHVVLPQNWYSRSILGINGPFTSTVMALGTTYPGRLDPVLRRC